jgi:hypothetical protein
MPNRPICVIPIRRKTPVSEADELVAGVAYSLWLSSPFRCGPPEKAFMTALRIVKGNSAAGLFLVPKRKDNLHPVTVMNPRSTAGRQAPVGDNPKLGGSILCPPDRWQNSGR